MNRKLLLSALITTLLFTGCTKNKPTGKEYFIFGFVSEQNVSDGVNVFMLKNGNVYADDSKTFSPGKKLTFEKTALSAFATNIAEQVRFSLPEYMKDRPNTRFGCPGCADGPAIYVELRENRNTTWWLLEDRNDALPPEIDFYADMIRNAVANLNL